MSSVVVSGDTSGAITISAPAISGTNTLTLPAVTDTLVGLAAAQTLTNKTLTTPNLGTPSTLVLTNATGLAAAAMPAGSVLQVVTAVKTDTFSTASTSFVAITGISVSITPSSTSSRIAVSVSLGAATSGASSYSAAFRVMRDSTAINVGDAAGSRPRASFRTAGISADHVQQAAFSCIDSPSSVSSITYTVQVASQSPQTLYINRTQNDSDGTDAYQARCASTITVMEIKG